MKAQIIKDNNGIPTGVFIPIEDWENMKQKYPNLDKENDDIPQWQKDILDIRIKDLDNPEKLKPVKSLLDILDQEI